MLRWLRVVLRLRKNEMSDYFVRSANGDIEELKSCSIDLGPRCANCHVTSLEMFACDFSAGGVVCNMVLCDACAAPQSNEKHHCPAHSGMRVIK